MKIYLDNNLGVEKVEQEELTQDTIGYNILKVYIPNAVLTPYDTFTCYYGALLQNGRKVGWFAMEARTSSDADYEENYTLYKATLEQCVVSVEGKVYIGCQVLLGNSGNATLIKKNTAVVQFNVRKSVAINNDILVLDTDQTNTDVLESYKNLLENALLTYATKATIYTKTEVDGKLDLKADKSDTYTKQEINEEATRIYTYIDQVDTSLNTRALHLENRTLDLENDVENLKSVQNVVEVVATKSALNSYDTSKLGIDDKVQVIADETHDGASTIYNWDGTQWQYVGAYGTNSYTKSEADNKFALKSTAYEAVSKADILNNNQIITPNNISNVFTYNKNDLNLLEYWVKLVDGVITIQAPATHKHIHMDLRNVKTISWVAGSSTVYVDYGFIVMEDDTIKSLGYHAGTFDITGAKELYFNFFGGGDYTSAFTIEYYSFNIEYYLFNSFNYRSCIDKPFDFNNSNIGFFGDSITKGHTSGTVITPNGFPKLFSDRVGATFVNEGVAGSTIAFVSGYGCISNKVMNSDLSSYDYIFIAGGINDWQLGVSITDFKSKLSELCVWLNSNYTGKVIFIAPINCLNTGNWGTNAINSIDVYRNIIAEYCITYGFSFVNGGEFNFSSIKNDFSNTLYGDGLHPSELGYQLYTKSLLTLLC